MRHTIQEKNNHQMFIVNIVLFFVSIMCFEMANLEYGRTQNLWWIVLFAIGLAGLIASFHISFYNGYCHGWELKRISMMQEEYEEDIEEDE